MSTHSIDGKYFIILQPESQGDRHGHRLYRGRIRGQLHEIIPVYLCDVWPLDGRDDPTQLTTQTLMTLEQLIQGWLYDDKTIWEVEFRQIHDRLEQARQAAEAAMRAQARKQRAMLKAAKAQGLVPVGLLAELFLGDAAHAGQQATADEDEDK